jgi:hypothetical protein
MTNIALHMPTTKRIRLKTIAKLFVVSVVITAGSPAVATQIARHDVHGRFCEQNAGAFRRQTFGPCISPKVDTPHWSGGAQTHDDWPANMILG